MSTDTVPVQNEVVDEVVEQAIEQVQPEDQDSEQEQVQEERVPLSALQRERRKRQETERELQWHKEQMMAKKAELPSEPDESLYESATKQDLGNVRKQVIREVYENAWIKSNPEKLTEFLKQRPNLASAIEGAQNRYEEAWELMDKLSPKQKIALKSAQARRDSPGNPAGIPKAAALNQSVDVMKMSDSEFNAWRQSQRKHR